MMRRFRRHKNAFSSIIFLLATFCLAIGFVVYLAEKCVLTTRLDPEKIVSQSALKQKSFTKTPKEVKTPSGIKFWLIEDPDSELISMSFYFTNSGRAYDPSGKSGRAVMYAENVFFGAGERNREEFDELLTLNGIELHLQAERDDLAGSLTTPVVSRNLAFEMLHDILSQPHFEQKHLETSKQQLLELLKIQKEKPQQVLQLAFFADLFQGHPYARNPLGKADDIKNFSRRDMLEYAKENLTRRHLIIGIAGNVSAKEAARLIDQTFAFLPADGGNRALPAPNPRFSGENLQIQRDGAQVNGIFAAPGTLRQSADFYPLYVANHIFGGSGLNSRLSMEAREKEGLTYGIYTYLVMDENAPLIVGSYATTPDKQEALEQILTTQWQKFATEGATAQELEKAKNYLLASYNLRFKTTSGLAQILSEMQKYNLNLDFLQKRNDYIRNISLEDVNRAAAKYYARLPRQATIGLPQKE